MKKIICYLGATCCLLLFATSCSVAMAARNDGTTVTRVQESRTRSQLIATGAKLVNREESYNGNFVETYQCKKKTGSAARALMHGCLDVCTLGIWEAVGTPVEACVNNEEYFTVKVTFDENEYIQKMELL